MIGHWRTRRRLYDYLQGSLDAAAQRSVAAHMARCSRCSREADEMRALLGVLGQASVNGSDERPAAFWDRFAEGVDRRIDAAGVRHPASSRTPRFAFPYRREVFAFAGGVALVLVAFGIWQIARKSAAPGPETRLAAGEIAAPARDTTSERVRDYFRRSRVLLVGLANMDQEEQAQLTAERRTSRALIEEARYLQTTPLDARAAKLIDDMDKILVELANLEETQGVSNVDLIRSGIHKENLLFKIRMAEQSYSTPQMLAARHTTERN